MRPAFLVMLIAAPAHAEQPAPLTGPEFVAEFVGKTAHYSYQGGYYGSEQFLSDREALWQFPDGRCMKGRWAQTEDGLLCFQYENFSCWRVYADDYLYEAISAEGQSVQVDRIDDAPLTCESLPLS